MFLFLISLGFLIIWPYKQTKYLAPSFTVFQEQASIVTAGPMQTYAEIHPSTFSLYIYSMR